MSLARPWVGSRHQNFAASQTRTNHVHVGTGVSVVICLFPGGQASSASESEYMQRFFSISRGKLFNLFFERLSISELKIQVLNH
ncbi:hypothetical protein BDR04DRAFT_1101421 [Suillus decipiens]|nr:hypothetical protein BDR04DRAFT_1101421 [Suillus decipiens]